MFLLLFGGIFTLAGGIQYYYPPKKINHFYGYRTTASMRSQEAWNFAQLYSAKLMIRMGLLLFVAGAILVWILETNPFGILLGIGIPLLFVAIFIFRIEREIAKRFPKAKKQKQ